MYREQYWACKDSDIEFSQTYSFDSTIKCEDHCIICVPRWITWNQILNWNSLLGSGNYMVSKKIQTYLPNRLWGPTKLCFLRFGTDIMGLMFIRGLIKYGDEPGYKGLHLELTGPIFELKRNFNCSSVCFSGISFGRFQDPLTLIREIDIPEFYRWRTKICNLWRTVRLGEGYRGYISLMDSFADYRTTDRNFNYLDIRDPQCYLLESKDLQSKQQVEI